jgi:transcription initiation factor TFIIE subunit alpha
MRLTQKKIEDILLVMLGDDGRSLIRELYGKENVSEFDLSKRAKKDIKIIRKQLYILHNNNLVGFTRKKDKIKGWYIYYWTLLPDNIKYVYLKKKREQLDKLKLRIEEENKELFFSCPKNCVRLNFDQATDFEFHCPECGELAVPDNREEKLALWNKMIREIEDELGEDNNKPEKKTIQEKSKKKRKVKMIKKTKIVKKKKK